MERKKNDDPPREAQKNFESQDEQTSYFAFCGTIKRKKMVTPLLNGEKNDDPPSKIVAPHADK